MATYAVCACVMRERKVVVDRLVSAPISLNLRELFHDVMSDVPATSNDQFTGLEIAVGEKRNGPWSTVSPTETVATIADLQFRYIQFKMIQPDIPPTATTTRSTVKPDVTQVLMATARSTRLPSKENVSNKKQAMFNDIIDLLEARGLGFPGATTETEGRYIVQVCVFLTSSIYPRINIVVNMIFL